MITYRQTIIADNPNNTSDVSSVVFSNSFPLNVWHRDTDINTNIESFNAGYTIEF